MRSGVATIFTAATLAIAILTTDFDNSRHVTLALVRIVTGVRIGRIADSMARRNLLRANGGEWNTLLITAIVNDLELIMQKLRRLVAFIDPMKLWLVGYARRNFMTPLP